MFSEDPELIAKVEHLWMVVHQNFYVPIFYMIFLGMIKGMVMEFKGGKNELGNVCWMD